MDSSKVSDGGKSTKSSNSDKASKRNSKDQQKGSPEQEVGVADLC